MEASFNHAEAFTLIARLVATTAGDADGFVDHRSIVSTMLGDPEGSALIARARTLSSFPDDRSCASNVVAWFSQQITVGASPWSGFFDRQRRGGTWAYRPRTAVQPPIAPDLELAAVEGEPRLFFHLRRERDPNVVQAKRNAVLAAGGHLRCEACGLDPEEQYPAPHGDICEIHHRRPLGEAVDPAPTRLEDLAVLCPNCHRAIHRTRPVMSVEEFRQKHFPGHSAGERQGR